MGNKVLDRQPVVWAGFSAGIISGAASIPYLWGDWLTRVFLNDERLVATQMGYGMDYGVYHRSFFWHQSYGAISLGNPESPRGGVLYRKTTS